MQRRCNPYSAGRTVLVPGGVLQYMMRAAWLSNYHVSVLRNVAKSFAYVRGGWSDVPGSSNQWRVILRSAQRTSSNMEPADREQITFWALLDWSSKVASVSRLYATTTLQPDWVPSWRGTTIILCLEDGGQNTSYCYINYLTSLTLCLALPFDGCYRVADGITVALKRIFKSEHPYESVIHQFLTSDASLPSQITIATTIRTIGGSGQWRHAATGHAISPSCGNPRFQTIVKPSSSSGKPLR